MGSDSDGWLLPPSQVLASPNFTRGRGRFRQADLLVLHYAVDGDVWDEASEEPDDDRPDPVLSARHPSDDCMDVARLFAKPKRRASSQFVIGRDASVVQCVRHTDTAWAQGGGAFPLNGPGPLEKPRRGEANQRGMSIELCNAGWAVDKLHVPRQNRQRAAHRFTPRRMREWETFPKAQIGALEYLVALMRPHMADTTYVLAHEDMVNTHTQQLRYGKPDKFYGSKVDLGPVFPWGAIPWRKYGLTPVMYDMGQRAWVERVL